MIGNPYKGVVQDPILEDSAPPLVLAATGVQNSVTYTVPTGRGKAQGLAVYLNNNTAADIGAASITVSASGKSLLNNSPLLKHSSLYNNDKKVTICQIDESTPITITGLGAANNAVTVRVVFFFYDSYITTFAPSINN